MKDNNHWVGGKLLPKYYDTWALFFSKYIDAYKEEGIDIWGFTVENEPMGNGNNWESMHYSPDEMTNFVQNYLGPKLEADGKGDVKDFRIRSKPSTFKRLGGLSCIKMKQLQSILMERPFIGTTVLLRFIQKNYRYAHNKAPNKLLIQTEACVDSEVPKWKDDAWYWSKEATDWGWDWASRRSKRHLHPKYSAS